MRRGQEEAKTAHALKPPILPRSLIALLTLKDRNDNMSQKSSNKKRETKRATPALAMQLPTSEKQELAPRKAGNTSGRKILISHTISVPLIRPSEDASKPAPRVLMDKEAIEAQGKRWGLHQQSSREAEGARNAQAKPAIKAKKNKAADGPIHKDMLISDIMLNYPQTLDILMAAGLHCIGCQLSAYDTLESGRALHGMDEATIAELVKAMNAKLKEDGGTKETGNTGTCCQE